MGTIARPMVGEPISVEVLDVTTSSRRDVTETASSRRRRTLHAVQMHGGHAAGGRLSRREECRRFTSSLPWQSSQLLAALTDVSMLLYDMAGGPLYLIQTVTGVVLAVYCVDLALRTYAYGKLALRSPCAWFDYIVVASSLVLYLVDLAADAGRSGGSRSAGVGLRALIVTTRWVRALRVGVVLVRASTNGQLAARHATGENKRRCADLDAVRRPTSPPRASTAALCERSWSGGNAPCPLNKLLAPRARAPVRVPRACAIDARCATRRRASTSTSSTSSRVSSPCQSPLPASPPSIGIPYPRSPGSSKPTTALAGGT